MQEISKALVKFQREFKGVKKDAQGHGYRYASLGNIVNSIRPLMADCELSFNHDYIKSEEVYTCTVIHSSGEHIKATVPFLIDATGRMKGMQAIGAAITYAKRYSLSAALGISDEDDTDGVTLEPKHSGNGGGDYSTRREGSNSETPYMEKTIPFGDSKGKSIKTCSTDELREYCKMVGNMKATGYALELSEEIKFENTKED